MKTHTQTPAPANAPALSVSPLVAAPADRYTPRGMIARPAIHCTHPESGLTGSWLFTGETHRAPGAAVSPVFDDCAALFQWAAANHWEQIGAGLSAAYSYRGPVAPSAPACMSR